LKKGGERLQIKVFEKEKIKRRSSLGTVGRWKGSLLACGKREAFPFVKGRWGGER